MWVLVFLFQLDGNLPWELIQLIADGMKAFFDLGPGQAPGSAEHGTLSVVFCANRWTGKVVAPASHYWKPVMMGGHRVWMVNGAESLGYKDDV